MLNERKKNRVPRERTLYSNPTVTIYLRGLLVFNYDLEMHIFQVGIHKNLTVEHKLRIRVRKKDEEGESEPFKKHYDLEEIIAMAPFELFIGVEDEQSKSERAELYEMDNTSIRQAYANVLNFKDFHPELEILPEMLVPLNILHGKFYSAALGKAEQRISGSSTGDAHKLGKRATVLAADITLTAGNVILRSEKDKKPLFCPLSLSSNVQYEIDIKYEPTGQHQAHNYDICPKNPYPNHFSDYYKAFDKRTYDKKYFVCVIDDEQELDDDLDPTTPQAPPCMSTRFGY